MLAFLAAAHASPAYPPELGAPCTPPCTVCHETGSGGAGTVTRSFGQALMDRGLTGGSDTAGLADALDAAAADGVDSDGDGTADVDALAEGLDPNDGAPVCDVPTPTYGCFDQAQAGAGLVAAAVAAGLARRRR